MQRRSEKIGTGEFFVGHRWETTLLEQNHWHIALRIGGLEKQIIVLVHIWY